MISVRARVAAVVAVLVVAMVGLNAGAATSAVPPPTPVPPHGVRRRSHRARDAERSLRVPTVPAAAALLADLDTGQILYAKDPRTPRPIASVTKMMTALLTLETLPLDHVVRVDPRAVFDRDDFGASSTLGLRAGERISVENLLYALLLGSANDAADALAIAVDGSIPAFVRHMNDRARQLGMLQTRYFSANGLDDRGHSTPSDLLRLARSTDALEIFRTITATRFRRIPAPTGRDRVIQNRNALLWLYAGAFGTKTGTTAGAGACLVASATRDGRRLVAIVLDAPGEPFSSAAASVGLRLRRLGGRGPVAGRPARTAAIRGGTCRCTPERPDALTPIRGGGVVERAVVDPRAAFLPATGEQVGVLVVRAGRCRPRA